MTNHKYPPRDRPKGVPRGYVPSPIENRDPDHVLTVRQRKIMRAIIESLEQRGVSPTMREIGRVVGLRSAASVRYQLDTLESAGYLQHVLSSKEPFTTPTRALATPERDA